MIEIESIEGDRLVGNECFFFLKNLLGIERTHDNATTQQQQQQDNR